MQPAAGSSTRTWLPRGGPAEMSPPDEPEPASAARAEGPWAAAPGRAGTTRGAARGQHLPWNVAATWWSGRGVGARRARASLRRPGRRPLGSGARSGRHHPRCIPRPALTLERGCNVVVRSMYRRSTSSEPAFSVRAQSPDPVSQVGAGVAHGAARGQVSDLYVAATWRSWSRRRRRRAAAARPDPEAAARRSPGRPAPSAAAPGRGVRRGEARRAPRSAAGVGDGRGSASRLHAAAH